MRCYPADYATKETNQKLTDLNLGMGDPKFWDRMNDSTVHMKVHWNKYTCTVFALIRDLLSNIGCLIPFLSVDRSTYRLFNLFAKYCSSFSVTLYVRSVGCPLWGPPPECPLEIERGINFAVARRANQGTKSFSTMYCITAYLKLLVMYGKIFSHCSLMISLKTASF